MAIFLVYARLPWVLINAVTAKVDFGVGASTYVSDFATTQDLVPLSAVVENGCRGLLRRGVRRHNIFLRRAHIPTFSLEAI